MERRRRRATAVRGKRSPVPSPSRDVQERVACWETGKPVLAACLAVGIARLWPAKGDTLGKGQRMAGAQPAREIVRATRHSGLCPKQATGT